MCCAPRPKEIKDKGEFMGEKKMMPPSPHLKNYSVNPCSRFQSENGSFQQA